MRGVVVEMEAQVDVVFRLPGRSDVSITFIVDTGFAGALTLPAKTITALGLPFEQEMEANLAGSQTIVTNVFGAIISWQSEDVPVAVLALGDRPLLGTALLEGTELTIQFAEGGTVTVSDL